MEHLEIRDTDGYTAFYYLICLFPERVEVAECMAKKNPNSLTILPCSDLLLLTQGQTKGEIMARYLYFLTPPERIQDILVTDAVEFISYDIGWDLIQRYPKLVIATNIDGNIPLGTLASICIKPLPPINKEKHESAQSDQRHHLISSAERYMRYYRCEKLKEALCVAEEQGHEEYITHFLIYSSCPVLEVRNEKNQSLFQIAAECRHYNVYDILYKDGLDQFKYGLHEPNGLKVSRDGTRRNEMGRDKTGRNGEGAKMLSDGNKEEEEGDGEMWNESFQGVRRNENSPKIRPMEQHVPPILGALNVGWNASSHFVPSRPTYQTAWDKTVILELFLGQMLATFPAR
ncbi:hypothetical protein DVH24_028349 [Malus domestica]|uniref:Uncharacterized protein n=1 Tax=Malus domestica TaxID=3750 RepID=A0A498HEA1_MALDO|nr:hypothetical protein DVH24_028349 [Malus domestica]